MTSPDQVDADMIAADVGAGRDGPLQRLQSESNVWVATARPDGRPHLAPVWFVYVDDRFWVGTGRTSVRVANLRHGPKASVALEDGNRPIVAECNVIVHERARPDAVVAAFRAKYGWDITVDVDDDIGEVVVLELRPTRWLFNSAPPPATVRNTSTPSAEHDGTAV